jgi:hypothetical protein
VESMTNYIPFFVTLTSLIKFFALTPINRMALLNANIVTL